MIRTGSGNDLVFGGTGDDTIIACGNPVYGGIDRDVVAGDNAQVTFTPGELSEVRTTDRQYAGKDTIFTGNGEDVVFGGGDDDTIDTGAYGPYDNGDLRVVSLNFGSDVFEGRVTGVAGAVQAGNWNNLIGVPARRETIFGDEPSETLLFSDGRAADGLTVEWGSHLDGTYFGTLHSGSHAQIANPNTANEHLFEGYLYAHPTAVLGVNLSSLQSIGTPYDLYVYLDASDTDFVAGDPQVTDGATTFYVDDGRGNTFAGEFVEVTATSAQTAQGGNYVVFRNLTADVARLRISSPDRITGTPALAAIQIVGGPEKDQVVLGGDVDRDVVVGDNGVGYWSEGRLYEVKTTDLATGGDDVIRTGDDTDLVLGGLGNDTIDGQAGHDVLLGDEGRLLLEDGCVVGLDFSDFNDWASGIEPYDIAGIILTHTSRGGNDRLEGGAGDDLLYGQFGDDTYVFSGSGLGRDALVEVGGAGEPGLPNDLHDGLDLSQFAGPAQVDLDVVGPQWVNDEIAGQEMNLSVVLFFGTAFEDVIGSAFADVIIGNGRDNVLCGLDGADTLYGEAGNDEIHGGNGDDRISGTAGDDLLYGDAGADTIDGVSGADTIYGGSGADTLNGGAGDDTISGDAGDDLIHGCTGNDRLNGGSGDDEIWGDQDNDELYGGAGNDRLFGGQHDDILEGGNGDDYLHGDDDNLWFSNYGHDRLAGGAGNDTIQGGGGANTVYFPGATNPVYVELDESGHGFAYDGLGGRDELRSIHEISDTESPAGRLSEVYRFWSPLHAHHFYTSSAAERDRILATYPNEVWTYEGVAFYAYAEGSQPEGTCPVYRFWSPLHGTHFYTISAAEKDGILADYPAEVWTYEGIAFYAYPSACGGPPAEGTSAVYRFWSPLHSGHFYTMSEAERDGILAEYPAEVWTYEGVAWYAYASFAPQTDLDEAALSGQHDSQPLGISRAVGDSRVPIEAKAHRSGKEVTRSCQKPVYLPLARKKLEEGEAQTLDTAKSVLQWSPAGSDAPTLTSSVPNPGAGFYRENVRLLVAHGTGSESRNATWRLGSSFRVGGEDWMIRPKKLERLEFLLTP